MSFDLNSLAIDLDAQRRGKMFFMMDHAGKATNFGLRILGPDSETSQRAKLGIREKHIKKSKITASDMDSATIDVLCAVITDWEGLNKDGEPVPFNGKNLRDVLTKYPVIREQAEVYANDRRFFIEQTAPVEEAPDNG